MYIYFGNHSMNFSKEDLNLLKCVVYLQTELLKYDFKNQEKYLENMFYMTWNIYCYSLYQQVKMKEIFLEFVKEYLKHIDHK